MWKDNIFKSSNQNMIIILSNVRAISDGSPSYNNFVWCTIDNDVSSGSIGFVD